MSELKDEIKLKKFGMVLEQATHCEDDLYELIDFVGVELVHGDSKLRIIGDDFWISWKLFELISTVPVQSGVPVEKKNYQVVMYGEGTANLHNPEDNSLREPRHTWIPDGYWFYVQPKAITWCFEQLARWYDYGE